MRVLILSQFFDPEPTLKGLAFAKALQREGWEVEVLTGYPNYPGGRLYPGYRRRLWSREVVDGIVINRVWLSPSHDRSAVRRIVTYASFAIVAAVIGPWLVRRPDAIYVHHPPPTISLPATILRLLTGAPFVYEIQDIWPDTLATTGMLSNPLLLRLVGAWCLRVYRSADRVVVISPGFEELLVQRGVPRERLEVIYNWCDEDRVVSSAKDPLLADELGIPKGFVVMFAGALGVPQGLTAVLEAAHYCLTTVPTARFIFVGDGMERIKLEQAARARKLSNVHFTGRQPLERMGPILALADVLLVHLRNDPLFAITIPSKTQAYMRMGVPIIMAVDGNAADIVRRSSGGIVCVPGDGAGIADAVAQLYALSADERSAIGAAGRKFYDTTLSLAVGAHRYARLLSEVSAPSRN